MNASGGSVRDGEKVVKGAGAPAEKRPPYLATALVMTGAILASGVMPWAKQHFGGMLPPFFARFEPNFGIAMLLPAALAFAGWMRLPNALRGPRWKFLVQAVGFAWLLALAIAAQSGRPAVLVEPLNRPLDYYSNVPLVDSLGVRAFSEAFPALITANRLSLHAATHPPGAPIFLWALSKATHGNLWLIAASIALIGAAGAIPTYFLARRAYGDGAARMATVLFATSPAVLLFSATSMDAVFMFACAVALAAMIRGLRSDLWALVGGSCLALATIFTLGALGLGLFAAGIWLVAIWRRGSEPSGSASESAPRILLRGLLMLAAFGATVLMLKVVVGIDLVAIYKSAAPRHLEDQPHRRSYGYWAAFNLVAFLTTAGIAQTALLARETRDRWADRRLGLETVALCALSILSLSGVFRGEVERIWLGYLPVVLVAAGHALGKLESPSAARRALAIGVAQAMLMEALLNTFW